MTSAQLLFLFGALSGAAAMTWLLVPLVIWFSARMGWLDRPGGRRSHPTPVPRVGGIAIMAGVLVGSCSYAVVMGWESLAGVLSKQELIAFFGPCLLVFLIGLLDDIRGLGPTPRLLVESIAAAMAIQAGYVIDVVATPFGPLSLGALAFPVSLMWFLAVTNAFNLIDGLDGLLATAGLVSLLGCAAIGLHGDMIGTPALALAMAGALLGILPWNWAPARIFLGDSGALLIGFTVAGWTLKVSRNHPNGTLALHVPLLLCALPLIEMSLTLARRYVSGVPFFEGDRSHMHHVLLQKGLGVRPAVGLLGGVASAFALAALLSRSWREWGMTSVLVPLALAAAGLRYLGYVELRVLGDRLWTVLRRPQRRLLSGLFTIARAGEVIRPASDLADLRERLRRAREVAGFSFLAVEWSEQAYGELGLAPERDAVLHPQAQAWVDAHPAERSWVFSADLQPETSTSTLVTWCVPVPAESGRYGRLACQSLVEHGTPAPSVDDIRRYLAEPLALVLMALEARGSRAHAK